MHTLPPSMMPLSNPKAQSRALAGCVLASILLHAVLLFLLPGMREGGTAGVPVQVLTAVLSPRSAPPALVPVPEVKPPPPRPQQPQVKTEAPRPVLSTPTPSPSAPVVATPPVAPAPVAPPVVAPPPPAAVVPRPAEPQPQAPAVQSTAPAGRLGAESADAGTLAQYRVALISAANRYKRYPAQAMEKGWQGKVEVRLAIGANGIIQTAVIRTSSGYPVLDDVALDMIRKAKPLTQIPQALRGREFVVDVPVIFDLRAG